MLSVQCCIQQAAGVPGVGQTKLLLLDPGNEELIVTCGSLIHYDSSAGQAELKPQPFHARCYCSLSGSTSIHLS
jgi:hypothetical protein